MSGLFDAAENEMFSRIQKADKAMPDDIEGIEAVREFVRLATRIAPKLTAIELALLIGAGAFLSRQVRTKFTAALLDRSKVLAAFPADGTQH